MLNNLFSSKARVEILKLFLFNPDSSFYQRQISELTKQPIRGVQREVSKFELLGLIEKSIQGNRIYYKTNRNCPIFEDLKHLFFKSYGIAEVLKKSLKNKADIAIAFIYGSYAKGEEVVSSDIDLMVIGVIKSRKFSALLSKPKSELGREINYTVISPEELRTGIRKGDHFLTNIALEKKIFIIGNEDELKTIIKSR
jgi:predicted nucleotidyltransferase